MVGSLCCCKTNQRPQFLGGQSADQKRLVAVGGAVEEFDLGAFQAEPVAEQARGEKVLASVFLARPAQPLGEADANTIAAWIAAGALR